MAALTDDRRRSNLFPPGVCYVRPLAADQIVYQGSIVVLDTTDGFWYTGATGTTYKAWGIAASPKDSTGLADGAIDVVVESGTFGHFDTATGADEILANDVGKACYLVNDNTWALTDGGGTRSGQAKVYDVTDEGLIVQFEESKP